MDFKGRQAVFFTFLILFFPMAKSAVWAPKIANKSYIRSQEIFPAPAIFNTTEQLDLDSHFDRVAPAPRKISDLKGFNELVPYVTPSPDQENAGTCLFMSLTGIVEWWLHKLNNVTQFVQDGPFDLSERWWVNLNTRWQAQLNPKQNQVLNSRQTSVVNWKTDTIYLYNQYPAALNRNYRYAKGWYAKVNDEVVKASSLSAGALYDANYNWIDEIDVARPMTIPIPKFERQVLFQDPSGEPWSFGSANNSLIDQVKLALQKFKAPIQVIYNHLGFWHSVFIVGFDDQLPTLNCYFINESIQYFDYEAKKAFKNAQKTMDEDTRKKFIDRYLLMLQSGKKLISVHKKNGGCHARGMFYVRDSQYSDNSEEKYKYDLQNPTANKFYSRRIILREYDWLSNLANHVILIYPQQSKFKF